MLQWTAAPGLTYSLCVTRDQRRKCQVEMVDLGEAAKRSLASLARFVETNQSSTSFSLELVALDALGQASSSETTVVIDRTAPWIGNLSVGAFAQDGLSATAVRTVELVKETQTTRLGIIFHQNTPEELANNTDQTPRGGGDESKVVIPIIKILDPSGIAGNCPELSVGDQVLSVNGVAALSNVQAVQMLREAVGTVRLAIISTKISVATPRAGASASPYSSGLRVLPQ